MKLLHTLIRPGLRAGATTAALAMATAGLAALGPAAQAATAAHPAGSAAGHAAFHKSFTIPAGTGTYTAAVGGTHVTVQRGIKDSTATTCTLSFMSPLPVGDEIGGEASVTCTAEVAEIMFAAVLNYASPSGWVTEAESPVTYGFNTTSDSVWVWTSTYMDGYWEIGAAGGYTVTSGSSSVALGPAYSSAIYINI